MYYCYCSLNTLINNNNNINLLVSGLHKIHIISDTVFHAARNLQGEGVVVAVVRFKLEKYEAEGGGGGGLMAVGEL